jgi:hypothetical protein
MIKNLNKFLACSIMIISSILGCVDAPDLSPIPTLEFVSVSKDMMKQGRLNQDSIILSLKFTDGDGDLGYLDSRDRKIDLFISDDRTGKLYDTYILPSIPQLGANNGILGTMQIKLYTQCCTLQPCDPAINQPDETLPLSIHIVDRAGNKSNVLKVDNLKLRCKK